MMFLRLVTSSRAPHETCQDTQLLIENDCQFGAQTFLGGLNCAGEKYKPRNSQILFSRYLSMLIDRIYPNGIGNFQWYVSFESS